MTSGSFLGDKSLQEIISPFHSTQGKRTAFPPYKKKIIILAGPTGVGKTRMSIQMAHAIGGEIISADSMQVYRGMDIGTAKATLEERRGIRHHLIDSRELDETFNVVDFYHEGQQAFREVFARDHVPIVVGGTGFYIHALIYGPPRGPASVPAVRERLEKEMEEKGATALYLQLKEFDPDYAMTITERDRQKIIRGLEIIQLTNQKVSYFEKGTTPTQEYDFRCWFLYKPKEILYPLLDERCELMLKEGLLEEIKRLDKEGLRKNQSASQAIGYRQGLHYLESAQTDQDRNYFEAEFKKASRRYAKRQMTWFRKEPLFRWINVYKLGLETAMEMIIQDYEQNI